MVVVSIAFMFVFFFKQKTAYEIVEAVAVTEPDLRERAGIRNVVHLHAKARGALYARLDAENRPVQVRSEDQLIQQWIRSPWKADADAVEGFIGVGSDEFANRRNDGDNRFARISRQHHNILRNDPAAKVRDSDRRL